MATTILTTVTVICGDDAPISESSYLVVGEDEPLWYAIGETNDNARTRAMEQHRASLRAVTS